MKEYFKLQYIMTMRMLSDGSHPIIGYFLAILYLSVFIGLSFFLFYKTAFAPYLYILVSLYFTAKLSEIKRNDFLKICFGNKRYRMVRMLENLTVALPFVIFLVCKQQFYPVIILIVLNIIMALSNFKTTHSFTIPTPFYKKPFEFTVGFRNTFFLFPIAYGLTVIAVTVGNFNLGIFSLLLIFLTVLSYYVKYENEYFVWSYSLSPAKFLMEKISIAFSFSFYLCIPIVILLSVIFFEYIGILLFSTLLGYLYLVTIILAKYTAYPDEMNFAQAILLVICIFFPPMLIAVIPYFANKSVSKLKVYLK